MVAGGGDVATLQRGEDGAVGCGLVVAVMEAAVAGVFADVRAGGEYLRAVEVFEGKSAHAGGVDEGGAVVKRVTAQVGGGVAAVAGRF